MWHASTYSRCPQLKVNPGSGSCSRCSVKECLNATGVYNHLEEEELWCHPAGVVIAVSTHSKTGTLAETTLQHAFGLLGHITLKYNRINLTWSIKMLKKKHRWKGLPCSNTARLSHALDDAFKAQRVSYCNDTADRAARATDPTLPTYAADLATIWP